MPMKRVKCKASVRAKAGGAGERVGGGVGDHEAEMGKDKGWGSSEGRGAAKGKEWQDKKTQGHSSSEDPETHPFTASKAVDKESF